MKRSVLATAPGVELDSADLPLGTTLRRFFKGRHYVVQVVRPIYPGGVDLEVARSRGWWRYLYEGRLYKTLSAVTFEITGERHLSGNRFFGLRLRRRRWRRAIRRTDRSTGP